MLAEAEQRTRAALPGKILVVDDEQRILGFVVDSADNGVGGLRKALESRYDLVILDLLMPGLDGTAVLRRLVAERPAQAVLVLSCLSATATKVQCLEAGAEADIGSGPVPLADREFLLLRELMLHAGATVSKQRLLSAVWKYHFDPGSNVVDVYVRRLRAKLGAEVITTMRGEGYRIAPR